MFVNGLGSVDYKKIPNSFAQTAKAPARIKTDLRIPQPHYPHLFHLHQLHSFM